MKPHPLATWQVSVPTFTPCGAACAEDTAVHNVTTAAPAVICRAFFRVGRMAWFLPSEWRETLETTSGSALPATGRITLRGMEPEII
jgi:hypothetical protein